MSTEDQSISTLWGVMQPLLSRAYESVGTGDIQRVLTSVAALDKRKKSGTDAEAALDTLIRQTMDSIQILGLKYDEENRIYSTRRGELIDQYPDAAQAKELNDAIDKYVDESGIGTLEKQYDAAKEYNKTQLSPAYNRYGQDNERFDLKALLDAVSDPTSPLSTLPIVDGEELAGTLGHRMVDCAKALVDTDGVYASDKPFVEALAEKYGLKS